MSKSIAVVGGMNIDLTGAPLGPLVLGDSNIGWVSLGFGGVGRNIAENLVRMGYGVQLIAPMGNDLYAGMLQKSCEELGIGLDYAVRLDGPSGVYLCLMDGKGDMHAAVNAMGICGGVRPEHIDMQAIARADAVVLDANLPEDVLLAAARGAKGPVIADPVSAAKCGRLLPSLPYIHAIKPNLTEAEALTGESDPGRAARALMGMGVKEAYVSLGREGMCFASRGCAGKTGYEGDDIEVVNATGAGDSATAAIAAGVAEGKNPAAIAALACMVAAMTIRCKESVSPELTADIIGR